MKIGFLFPGQGAQSIGMGKDLYENYQEVRDIYENVHKITGVDIKKITFDGTEKELSNKEWKELDSDIIFTPFSKESPDYDPNLENYNIKQIRSFIKECQEQGKPLSMRVGELKIDISDTNPKQVTFTSNGRLSSGKLVTHNNFPYSLTIRGNEIFSQVNLTDDEKYVTYMTSGKEYIPVKINQQIDIINAEDVTERFIIKPKQQEYDISEDMSEYVSQNSEFQVENHNELVREVSNHSEKIKRL